MSYIALFLAFVLVLYPVLHFISEKIVEGEALENDKLLISRFTWTYFVVCIGLLVFFGIFSHFVVHYMTRPIKEIILSLLSYEKNGGKGPLAISLEAGIKKKDEFGLLAEKLNSLSSQIEKQMASVNHEKNEKEEILESLVEGVIAVDKKQNIVYMNRTAIDFLAVNKEAVIGNSFTLLRNKECCYLIEEVIKNNKSIVSLVRINRKPRKYLDVIAVPRSEGGAILVLQDKTSLHKIVEQGRDFVANASHELKTPITIIRGFAETLNDNPELTKEITKEITHKIVSNCQRMDTLVRNLLTLAALDEGLPSSRLKECDLFDLAERARLTVLNVHPNAQIKIEEKGNPTLMGDNDLLFQAILNLMDNAAKYSKPPAQISVIAEKSDSAVELLIKDQGIGIAHNELERIFERFYAVDKSHSRSLGGSGLGLSIVESIVEKHRGHIEVESIVGEGTTFRIIFPLNNK